MLVKSRLSNLAHFLSGLVASLDPGVAVATSMLFIAYQFIDMYKNYEPASETMHDIIEFTSGLLTGVLVKTLVGWLGW
jgi:hypothetical protein